MLSARELKELPLNLLKEKLDLEIEILNDALKIYELRKQLERMNEEQESKLQQTSLKD